MVQRKKILRIFLFLFLLCVLFGCSSKLPDSQQDALWGSSSLNQQGDLSAEAHSELKKNTYDSNAFYEENGLIKYKDAKVGIDVSVHQGEIDWSLVKTAGVDFAIIRAAYRGNTDGNINMDPLFLENIAGARENNIQVGVYLFSQAISEEEAIEEAEFVLQCLDGVQLDLPVYFDWEPAGEESRTFGISGGDVTRYAAAFCERIRTAGYKTGVYFNESMGYAFLDIGLLTDHEFWLAQYQDAPDFYYDFAMWQNSEDGEIQGIDTKVDLNLRFVNN